MSGNARRMLAAVVLVALSACRERPPTSPSSANPPGPETPPTTAAPPPPIAAPPPAIVPPFTLTNAVAHAVVVGDIGMCTERDAVQRTADLVARLPGQLLLAGDLAYMQGTLQDFRDCFDPAWGRFRTRWHPVPGNHEYESPRAAGYLQYFGDAAGPPGRTFYSVRLGDWLVLMLDSNAAVLPGSDQYEFVRAELHSKRAPCAMAVWHHPLFSSGPNGPQGFMRELWQLLDEHEVDVVAAAHDHLYERFDKQDAHGRADPRGIRQFIAGTGGARLYEIPRREANSMARERANGVLQLTLQSRSYEWRFLDVSGAALDAGSDVCH